MVGSESESSTLLKIEQNIFLTVKLSEWLLTNVCH